MEGHHEDQGQTDTWVSLGSLALNIMREAEGDVTRPVLAGGSFVAGKEGGARRSAAPVCRAREDNRSGSREAMRERNAPAGWAGLRSRLLATGQQSVVRAMRL